MDILDSLIKRLMEVFSTENYVVQEIEEAITFSDASWARVNKSKLPASCFLIVGDPKKKTTWHLPYREGAGGIDPNTGMYRKAGPVNKGAIRALLQLFGGSRGGIKNFSVPAEVKAKVQALAKQAKIGAPAAKKEDLNSYASYIIEQEVFGDDTGQSYKRRISEDLAFNLTEAKFEEGTKKVELTLLKSGWSKNGNFHPKDQIEQLLPLIESRPKMYLDHKILPENQRHMKLSRSTSEWAATIEKVWVDGDELKAVVEFTDNPNTVWLFEEAKKYPDQVQVSVDIMAEVQEGFEEGGKKGTLIKQYLFYFSGDFVSYASAGGKVVGIAADLNDDFTWEQVGIIGEAIRSLDQIINQEQRERYYWDLFSALRQVLRDIANATDVNDVQKPALIDAALSDFVAKIKSLDVVSLLKNNPEAVEAVVNGSINKEVGKMEKTLQERIQDLENDTELLEAIRQKIISEGKEKQLQDRVKELEAEIVENKKKLDEWKQNIQEAEKILKERNALKVKDTFEEVIKEKKAEAVVTDGLKKKFIDEAEWSDDYREKLEQELEERLAVLAKANKVEGFGSSSGKASGDGEKKEVTLEEAQKILFHESQFGA